VAVVTIYNDLRIMGRAAAPSILVERSARAPLIWGLLQSVPSSAPRPPLPLAFTVTCVGRANGRNLDPGVCPYPLRAIGKQEKPVAELSAADWHIKSQVRRADLERRLQAHARSVRVWWAAA
jgi:hypothetical protein